MYQVYDGFIFPTQRWYEKLMNYFPNVKVNPKEPHEHALLIHLQWRRLIHTTEMITDSAVISDLLEGVCEIYFQLEEKNFVRSDGTKTRIYFNPTEQLRKGLEQVSVLFIFHIASTYHNGSFIHRTIFSQISQKSSIS